MTPRADSTWTPSDVRNFLEGAQSYRSRVVVTAKRLGEQVTWKTASGSNLTAEAGDWLVSDGESSWTVAADVFATTYREVGSGSFTKTALVVARQLAVKVTIATMEGPATGNAGDWVVRNPGGDAWPVPDREFKRRYEPVVG
ncbi:hypothetical protein [Nocardioides sp. Soil774]|uniref:hypothetical protein n=1 Tax=Nocardioides sp. Soil774 TaxID=1736408 RepID=UPI0012F7BC89|nr:hypothetical protein [Nocardioides sp. Soil774]